MSFYPAKVLGALGDAGAVFTNDEGIYESYVLQRDHGRDPETGEVVAWGLNLRMDNLQAAILNFKLQTYDTVIKRRRSIAQIYHGNLKGLEQLVLPPMPQENSDHFDIYQNYELEAQQRDGLKSFLSGQGIGTMIQWGGKAVHQYTKLGLDSRPLPKTEAMFKRMLMLPVNMSISNEDIYYICEKIKDFYKY